jgi:hypothetical protein
MAARREKRVDEQALVARFNELGVKGVLRQMAKDGQLIELRCEMPWCDCPLGRSHFEKRGEPPHDWCVSMDHYPILKEHDGGRYVDNARLTHVLCNQRDYTLRKLISDRLKEKKSLQQIAEDLNSRKDPRIPFGRRWTPAGVREFFTS